MDELENKLLQEVLRAKDLIWQIEELEGVVRNMFKHWVLNGDEFQQICDYVNSLKKRKLREAYYHIYIQLKEIVETGESE